MGYKHTGAEGEAEVRRDGEFYEVHTRTRNPDTAEGVAIRAAHGNPSDAPGRATARLDSINVGLEHLQPRIQRVVSNVFGPIGFAALITLTGYVLFLEAIGWTRLFPNVPHIAWAGVAVSLSFIAMAHYAKRAYERGEHIIGVIWTAVASLCFLLSVAAALTTQSTNAAERLEAAQSARADRSSLRDERRSLQVELQAIPPQAQSIRAMQARLDVVRNSSSEIIIDGAIPTRAELLEMCEAGTVEGAPCAQTLAMVELLASDIESAEQNRERRAALQARLAAIDGRDGAPGLMDEATIDGWGTQWETLAATLGVDPVTVQTFSYAGLTIILLLLVMAGWLLYFHNRRTRLG